MPHKVFSALFLPTILAIALPASAQSVIAQIPVPGIAGNVAVNPLNNRIYVATISSSTDSNAFLSVIDGRTRTVTKTFTLGFDTPGLVKVNPVTQKVYMQACEFLRVAEPSCDLVVFDGALTRILADLPNSGAPVAVDPRLNRIYVINPDGFAVINGRTDQVIRQIELPGSGAAAIDVFRNRMYAVVNNHELAVIDLHSNRVIETVAIEPGADKIAINPVTRRAYITHPNFVNTNPSQMSVLSLEDFHVLAHVTVAAAPTGVFADPRANIIFVADSLAMTAIDGRSNKITATIENATSAEPDLASGLVYAGTSLVFFTETISGRIDVIKEPRRNRRNKDGDEDTDDN